MPDDGNPVLFRRAGRGFDRKAVRRMAARLRTEVAGGRSFTCLLTGDSELRRLNRQFRAKDHPTDVLSFPQQAPSRQNLAEPLGEIAISVDRARQQAAERGHGVEDEIGILMLHGLLHLIGFDHERDRGRMAAAERRWRERLGLPVGLIERTKRR
jgi:probable rRNA maturation factor